MFASTFRKALSVTLIVAFVVVAAFGFGRYVYPQKPALVWGLLFLCWACYRLRMLAVARFGPRTAAIPAVMDAPQQQG